MPGDYPKADRRAQKANPEFFSIASGGVYLRLHPVSRHAQDTLFFDGRGVASVPPVPWPSALKIAEYDMVHVAGTHLPIAILPNAQAIVRARQKDKSWTFDAVATGLPEPSSFELEQTGELAYQDGRVGLHVAWFDPHGSRRSSLFHPLRADGALIDPPLAVPTQLDSSDRPARCAATQKSGTPRVVARFQPGTRHPVVIADAVEPLRVLLTDQAVMHGAPDSACVSAWEAEPVEMDASVAPNEPLRAILLNDDLEHAWLFRSTQESRGEAAIEWRSMNCRFDPTLEIPAEASSAGDAGSAGALREQAKGGHSKACAFGTQVAAVGRPRTGRMLIAMAQSATSPFAGNGSSLGLKVGAGTPPGEVIASVDAFVHLFEGRCVSDEWRDVAPEKFTALRAYVRMVLAALDFIESGEPAGFHKLTDAERDKLGELQDRLDELLDTLGWAAESPGELAELADAESCA